MLHLHTQANASFPWSTIDMDFMNLNQAAHGDREFAHIGAASAFAARPSPGTSPILTWSAYRDWAHAAPAGPPGHHPTGPLRRQHARRRRHRRRQGRGRAPVRRLGEHLRCQRSRRGRRRSREDRRGRARRPSTWTCTTWPRSCAGRRTARQPALPRENRGRPSPVPDEGGFAAFTTNFEDLGGLRQLPGLAVHG